MSGFKLQVTTGEGRLTRRGHRILFVERHDPGLAELAGHDLGIGIRELAGYAVTNDACPAFVFIDLGDSTMLAHGDPGLESLSEDDSPLRSSSLGFVEGTISPSSVLACNHSPESADTSLDAGTVPAAGFLLLGPESTFESGTANESTATIHETASIGGPSAVGRTASTQSIAAGSEASDVSDGIDLSAPSVAQPSDPLDNWDPLQRDPGIDLDLIGSPTFAAPPSEQSEPPGMLDDLLDATPSAPPNLPDLDDTTDLTGTSDVVEIVQTSSTAPAPEGDSGPGGVDLDNLPPIPDMPTSPVSAAVTLREPINPDLRATVPSSGRTQRGIQLTFDDGQVHTIRSGAVVGRNPTKEQVPADFTIITVRSEHVSRRHWRIDFKDGQPTISDLGSQAGTIIETIDGSRPVPTTGMVVQSNERVVFADRWATIDRL